MEEHTKKMLIYVCIGVVILIIIRFLYLNQNDINNKYEGFEIENIDSSGNAIDLISAKLKSSNILNSVIDIDNNNLDVINYWSNKLYNMQTNTLQQAKPIALYKPNLIINNTKYCKLGDMVSQDINYNPPSATEFTLLIKQSGSKIQPPTDYSLVVDSGNKTIDPDYYNYVNYFTNISSLNNISTSISNCSNSLDRLNSIIQDNIALVQTALQTNVNNNGFTYIGNKKRTIDKCISNPITIPTNGNNNFFLPSGISLTCTDKSGTTTDINIPNNLDNIANNPDLDYDTKIHNILSDLPQQYYYFNKQNIRIFNYNISIFSNIPTLTVINYIKNLCQDIKNIYDTNNIGLINYLKLAKNESTVISILNIIKNTDIKNFNIQKLAKFIDQNTLLGITINIIINSKLNYNLTYLVFAPNTYINKPINPIQTSVINFNNNIISNIPVSAFDITSSTNSKNCEQICSSNYDLYYEIQNLLNNTIPKTSKFLQFATNLQNQTIGDFPLQIYNPIPPDGYLSLGHIFCNLSSDLEKIKADQTVACVPFNCVKEIRDWLPSDKIFEYNKNGVYWAIYYNPYTGTFISTTTSQLPLGKVSKVVACVKKCTAVDDLKKADDCARKYLNINKKAISSTPIIPNLVSDQEEEFYLSKIKVQSDSIAKLGQRAQDMQLTMDKATIVNREMNKNKLQNYVDTQKINIGIIMQKLIDDKNKIHTNINAKLATVNKLITIIKGGVLPPEQKNFLIAKIIEIQTQAGAMTNDEYQANMNKVLSSCPEYDLTGLVKKSTVSDVCYGCDSPP